MTGHAPSLWDATRVWARIGVLSFGGPAGQIALMHRVLVQERRWLGDRRFLHALNYCMVLPGPEAMQLAVYIGWLMNRTAGGVIAGVLFILPGLVSIMGLSWIYALYGSTGPVEALFFGLKAAVLAIVLQAVHRIGARVLRTWPLRIIAAVAFVAIFAFGVAFPWIVLGAGLVGFWGVRAGWSGLLAPDGHRAGVDVAEADTVLGEDLPAHAQGGARGAMRFAAVVLALWLVPVAGLTLILGGGHVFAQIAQFFSVLAVVTFGGAYAVLAYVAQEAVQGYGWLAPGEMLDGLGMAETTPGPLIMVTQFVGFMGAWREAGALSPLVAGTLGGLLATWVTFTPSFLWIFLGAPHVERLRGSRVLAGALGAITAAVVGVILNLAIWFASHVLFADHTTITGLGLELELPVATSVNGAAAVLVAMALGGLFVRRVGPMTLLSGCALLGIALGQVGWI